MAEPGADVARKLVYTAPVQSGKTYVIRRWLAKFLRENPNAEVWMATPSEKDPNYLKARSEQANREARGEAVEGTSEQGLTTGASKDATGAVKGTGAGVDSPDSEKPIPTAGSTEGSAGGIGGANASGAGTVSVSRGDSGRARESGERR